MSHERVMLVHYNPRQIDALSRALEGAGISVDVCSDGMAALDTLSSTHPDLIILEAMIPKKNGFEVCREIKSRPDGKHIPVVITSDIHRGRRYRNDAMTVYGCQEFLERGFTPEQLVQTVRRLLPGAFLDAPGATAAAADSGRTREAGAGGAAGTGAATEFDEGEISALLDTIFPSDDASDLAARLRSRSEALLSDDIDPAFGPGSAPAERAADSTGAVESGIAADSTSAAAPVGAAARTDASEDASSEPRVTPGPLAPPADESWSFGEIDTASMQGEYDLPSLAQAVEPPNRDSRLIEALESLDTPAPARQTYSAAVATLDEALAEVGSTDLPAETGLADSRIEDVVAGLRRDRGESSALDFPEDAASRPAGRAGSGAPRMIPMLAAAVVGASALSAGAWWMFSSPSPAPAVTAGIAATPELLSPDTANETALLTEPVSARSAGSSRPGTALAGAVPRPVAGSPSPAPAAPSAPAEKAAARTEPPSSTASSPEASASDGSQDAVTNPVPAGEAPAVEAATGNTPEAGLAEPPSGSDTQGEEEGEAMIGSPAEAEAGLAAAGTGVQLPVRTLATEPGALVGVDDTDVRPAHVSTPAPAYPPSARSLRIFGDVSMQVLVLENGAVGDVRVLTSPAPSLSDAASKAVRTWRYSPAQKDGVRVRTWTNEKISFRLK